MAYNQESRFPPTPKYYRFLDPGAYQYDKKDFRQNTAPFLIKAPRNLSTSGKIWTHSIQNTRMPNSIPNCSVFMSRTPRFPYQAFGPKDLEEFLCRCGLNVCECPVEEETKPETVCQRKTKKILFKGPTRKCSIQKISNFPTHKINNVPFYDTRVKEATEFYQGWKWSQRTSSRTQKLRSDIPGPADYFLEKEKPAHEKCVEQLREYRRLNSRQLRFIEFIQRQNMLEEKPGPDKYHPQLPKGPELTIYGPKAERFQTLTKDDLTYPGPADYSIKRNFDVPQFPAQICKARLPEPACFGGKAARFEKQKESGPSPADYTVNDKVCNFVHCQQGPFNSTEERLKADKMDNTGLWRPHHSEKECTKQTWPFQSRTIRMKALRKELEEPSPADCPLQVDKVERSQKLQYVAPFASSEGRFTPWFDWLPIYGRDELPGPCYYRLERPECYPAVRSGPLCRSERFPRKRDLNPAPNEYKVGGGMESVLATHNVILKNNIKHKHIYAWEPPPPPKYYTPEEREKQIIAKCIALLEYEDGEEMTGYEGFIQDKRKRKARMERERREKEKAERERRKQERMAKKLRSMKSEAVLRAEELGKDKLLRYFLYRHHMPVSY